MGATMLYETANQHGIVIGIWYSNTDVPASITSTSYNNTFYGNNNGVLSDDAVRHGNWENNISAITPIIT